MDELVVHYQIHTASIPYTTKNIQLQLRTPPNPYNINFVHYQNHTTSTYHIQNHRKYIPLSSLW